MNILVVPCRFDIKHVSGLGGRSPPRGGVDPNSGNQQFVLSSSEDEEAGEGADEPGPALTKKQAERQKVGIFLIFPSVNNQSPSPPPLSHTHTRTGAKLPSSGELFC